MCRFSTYRLSIFRSAFAALLSSRAIIANPQKQTAPGMIFSIMGAQHSTV